MKRIPIFVLVFLLFASLVPFSAHGQDIPRLQPEASRQRILLALSPGISLDDVARILAAEKCFLPLDERMALADGKHLIGWLDPASPDLPSDNAALYQLLDRLQRYPAIDYAGPFLVSPNGALFGPTNEVFVKLRRPEDLPALRTIAARLQLDMGQENEYLPRLYTLRPPSDAPFNAMGLAVWLRDRDVFEYVDLNYFLNPIVATNDPFFIHQWSLDNTGIPIQGSGTVGADMSVVDAWTVTTGNPNIRIAIIDSGTDTAHADLKDNLLPGHDASGGSSQGYPNLTYDQDAHGTNCAGIAGAKGDNNIGVAGVCYDCSIFPVKVFYYIFNPFGDPLPLSQGTSMAEAISWAWQVGEADILSNSWGIPDNLIPVLPGGSAIVEDAIQMALDSGRGGKGALLFFSSGNDGGKPIWPGRLAGCFSVNATSMCDERKYPGSCDGQNWEGNWGDSLDVSAPGVRVAATDISGTDGYDPSDYNLSFGGTSAACPNAAGVMGLVLSVEPSLNLGDAHRILESTCDRVGGYTYAGSGPSGTWSDELGYGRVNAHAAVLAAQNFVSMEEVFHPEFGFEIGPNPASEYFDLSVNLGKAAEISWEVRDVSGKLVYEEKVGQVSATSYRWRVEKSVLFTQSRVLFLTLNVSGHKFTKKLLIIN